MKSDPLLRVLRKFGDDAELSFGAPITVLTAGARIEGAVARSVDFAERFDADTSEAFLRGAERFGDDAEGRAAQAFGDAFAARPTHGPLVKRDERRRALNTQIEALADGAPDRAELQAEFDALDKPSSVLILREPKIWTYGYNPLHGPLTPPYIRIAVSAITAWYLGTSDTPPEDA